MAAMGHHRGGVSKVDVPAMVRAAEVPTRNTHNRHKIPLWTRWRLTTRNQYKWMARFRPFGEWRLRGVKRGLFAEMARTDRQDEAIWPALWKTNLPTVTHEFI